MLSLERNQAAIHFGNDRLLFTIRCRRIIRQSRGVSQQQRSIAQQRDLDTLLVQDDRQLDGQR